MKTIKTDYAKIAGYYDKVRALTRESLNFWLEVFSKFGGIRENSRVLDVGCGTGRFTIPLAAKTNATVYGLDSSSEMLEKAKSKNKGGVVKWIQGRAEGLQFDDGHFDCVLMSYTIHHVDDMRKAIEEMYRVLKDQGRCVILTSSHGQIGRSVIHKFPKIRKIDLERFPSIPKLKRMMTSSGFKVVHRHIIKSAKRLVPIEQYLDRVKKKPFSTLTLLTEDEFTNGLKEFEKRIRRKYGEKIPVGLESGISSYENTLVVGEI